MRKQFHTPDGIIERELTLDELEQFALAGDQKARLEITKQRWDSPEGVAIRQELICKLLGIIEWE